MPQTVLGIILGGGAGSRLYPLTKKRAKPAVPLGANYRLIDIPVSNCLNSNITKVYCLTQYNSASLNRHLSQVRQGRPQLVKRTPPARITCQVLSYAVASERSPVFGCSPDPSPSPSALGNRAAFVCYLKN